MDFITNKEKGNSGLGMAIAYFSTNNYTVSIPLNDTQDYDLVIEKNNILKTVQVKATGCKRKNGVYQVALKSCGGTKGKTYKTIIDTNIDYIFILTENKEIYLISKEEIKNRTTLNLCNKYEKYRVEI
ncbi:MAG: group I intron-associated PD-(D/E)XK endonuclease [Clostridia bacterium]|nr:group I intron-associated PD-(D/E)XK endonuclease [Clostridia bacterium]